MADRFQLCANCRAERKKASEEPCKSCSRAYIDRYTPITTYQWLENVLDVIDAAKMARTHGSLQIESIEFDGDGATVLLYGEGAPELAKERKGQCTQTEYFNHYLVGNVDFVSRRFDIDG